MKKISRLVSLCALGCGVLCNILAVGATNIQEESTYVQIEEEDQEAIEQEVRQIRWEIAQTQKQVAEECFGTDFTGYDYIDYYTLFIDSSYENTALMSAYRETRFSTKVGGIIPLGIYVKDTQAMIITVTPDKALVLTTFNLAPGPNSQNIIDTGFGVPFAIVEEQSTEVGIMA